MSNRPLLLSDAQRTLLTSWIRAGTTPQRVVKRARIALMAADGHSTRTIAAALEVSPRTVMLWRRRCAEAGPTSLWRDAPGRGRKSSIPVEKLSRLRVLIASPPPEGGRWSVRRLAKITGLSPSSVHRALRVAGHGPLSDAAPHKRRRQAFPRTAALSVSLL